ncbi:hypothetical protein GN958_ATG01937 [Phytophthora infestans]|uniref:Uncharacterized protein n=1 Tax=Phytophthora infestans TaxID=4787 RepID=A0A8S9V8E7_PHYIN|nr:hypothetical protein GN958_ATG01937 [Phytophthora infestans]
METVSTEALPNASSDFLFIQTSSADAHETDNDNIEDADQLSYKKSTQRF